MTIKDPQDLDGSCSPALIEALGELQSSAARRMRAEMERHIKGLRQETVASAREGPRSDLEDGVAQLEGLDSWLDPSDEQLRVEGAARAIMDEARRRIRLALAALRHELEK